MHSHCDWWSGKTALRNRIFQKRSTSMEGSPTLVLPPKYMVSGYLLQRISGHGVPC